MSYPKLVPEFKVKWIKALRSGEYAQGQSCLRLNEGSKPQFCCLGVACDLFDSSRWGYQPPPDSERRKEQEWAGESRLPPNELDEEVFVLKSRVNDEMNLADVLYDAFDKLARLNDNGKTFVEIADWIEENL